MRIVNDNGTVFLVGRKGKMGVADMPFFDALKAIDDVENGSTDPTGSGIESDKGFVVKNN